MQQIFIVPTGTANVASVTAAFKRLNVEPKMVETPEDILTAKHLILPGVGAFAASMQELVTQKWIEPLKQRIANNLPTLCICVGLQLLCESSEESPGVQGLGVIQGEVKRFGTNVRVPQHGWNTIEATSECRVLQSGSAYFSNSYCLQQKPEGFSVAMSEHGKPFVAALEKDNLIVCQFHPELSGVYGSQLLQRFMELKSC